MKANYFKIALGLIIFVLLRFVISWPISAQGEVDVTPPVLEDFSFTPTIIDIRTGAADISFTLHVTDDLSGVDHGYIYFRKPSGSTISTNRFSASVSCTINDGIYQVVMTLPQGCETGIWEISRIWIPDKTGNSMNIGTNELQLMGFPYQFEVYFFCD